MAAAVRSEVRKILSARALLALPAFAVVYAFLSFLPALALPEAERRELDADLLVTIARGPGFVVAAAMLVLGALVAAGEFRHKTMTATLLVRPRRREVMAAKAVAVALVAALTAVVVEVIVLSIGVAFVQANGIESDAGIADIASSAVAVLAVAPLYGVAGVGIGMAVRDQTAAVGGVLTWIGIVEGAIPAVLRKAWLAKWLPGGAARAVLGVADAPSDLLPFWGGALILLAVATVTTTAGTLLFAARDVD